jgi:hypothetical protein
MKTVEEVYANIDSFGFGYIDGDGEWVEISPADDLKEHAASLRCSEELLGAIVTSYSIFKDMVKKDLKDIWNQEKL